MDVLAQSAPALGRTRQPKLLDRANRTIKRNPRHDLGMRELSPSPTNFPKPFIGQVPTLLEVLDALSLEVPGRVTRGQSHPARLVKRIEHLAIDGWSAAALPMRTGAASS
jgi:hypothetical protein